MSELAGGSENKTTKARPVKRLDRADAIDGDFVYGTLKRGYCRAQWWPSLPRSVETAWIRGHLYGRHIEVEFVAKLRDEEKFNDLPALTAQMHRDAEQARRILSEHRLRATA